MELKEYYDIILSKYNKGSFKMKIAKAVDYEIELNQKEFPLYALNYMIYEYLKDNKDNRWKLLLDFILVPNGVNRKGCDVDFTKVDFEDFFYFMISIKS
jgi:hypothetical protein